MSAASLFQPASSFNTGNERFLASEAKCVHVQTEQQGEEYRYVKIQRQPEAESLIKKHLLSLGLERVEGAIYRPKSIGLHTGTLNHYIGWLSDHEETLQNAGFHIIQGGEGRAYFLGKVKLEWRVEEKNDWFDVHCMVQFGAFSFPLLKLKKYILQGIREFLLPDNTVAILPEEWFTQYRDLLTLASESPTGNIKLKKHHFSLIEDLKVFLEDSLEVEGITQELARWQEDAEPEPLPENFAPILRPYQAKGFRWMRFLQKNGFGGILADDMGLGKTVQTLALLQQLKTETPEEMTATEAPTTLFGPVNEVRIKRTIPSLIVMPTSLIHNWAYEVRKFAPSLRVVQYTGLDRETRLKFFNSADIVLSTYGTVRNDIELLQKFEFNYVILDESQIIKNPTAKITKAVKALRSRHRLNLSGTPIENSLTDLWSQLSFLNPDLLGTYQFFKDAFVLPIEKKNDEERKAQLRKILEPFILRRTKEQVAPELPELTEKVFFTEMTEEQAKLYNEVRNFYRSKILENIDQFGERKSQFFILKGLLELRLLANHPRLLRKDAEAESGKFADMLDSMNNILAEGHKILIFSQFVRHLELLRSHLEQENIPYAMLTGGTVKRQEVVQAFKDSQDCKVFLISLKAGGVGLNLTEAEYVFLLDPWWNPAAEKQAINRAHRIGQKQKVFAYKFISKDTVEEKILLLQEKKLRLSADFISAAQATDQRILTRADVDVLFG